MATDKHTVSAPDLIGYESHFTIAMQVGQGMSKHLKVIATLRADGATAEYFVDSLGKMKYQGTSLADAVSAYNAG